VLCEERNLPPIQACVEAAGVVAADRRLFDARTGAALVQAFPLGRAAGEAEARRIVDEFKPTAMVFIEKAGPNQHGIFHSIMGTGRGDDMMANAHCLVDIAKAEGILTIGIGDGGNEIGFGLVAEAVRDIQPYGRVCQCPCKGGVATITGTDVLVAAAVSNWGAYGIAAMIAALVKDPDVLHDTAAEHRMLVECVKAGGMDGAVARLVPMVDGTSADVQTSLITILHEIVRNGLKSFSRPF
jgi:hypothetical protein